MMQQFDTSCFEMAQVWPVRVGPFLQAGLYHLRWRMANQADRLVQAYVDGHLTQVSTDPVQRSMWLTLDASCTHLIELVAVDASGDADPWQPWSNASAGGCSGFVVLRMIRDARWPQGAVVVVRVDGNEVDRKSVWPASVSRGGFGSLFGVGGFGHDAATGPGLGVAALGHGPLGADTSPLSVQVAGLAPGDHTIELRIQDAAGQWIDQGGYQTTVTVSSQSNIEQLSLDGSGQLVWDIQRLEAI